MIFCDIYHTGPLPPEHSTPYCMIGVDLAYQLEERFERGFDSSRDQRWSNMPKKRYVASRRGARIHLVGPHRKSPMLACLDYDAIAILLSHTEPELNFPNHVLECCVHIHEPGKGRSKCRIRGRVVTGKKVRQLA